MENKTTQKVANSLLSILLVITGLMFAAMFSGCTKTIDNTEYIEVPAGGVDVAEMDTIQFVIKSRRVYSFYNAENGLQVWGFYSEQTPDFDMLGRDTLSIPVPKSIYTVSNLADGTDYRFAELDSMSSDSVYVEGNDGWVAYPVAVE